MAKPRIQLFVDIVSPFAYIAYYILRHDPVFKKCNITYTPIFLGGLFKICGTTPPLNIKNKDKWISRERERWAAYFSVPISANVPENFPPNTLSVMRSLAVLAASPGDGQAQLTLALDELYREFWVNSVPVHEIDRFSEVLGRVLGANEAEKAVSKLDKEGKALLTQYTQDAYNAGAFGLPWMLCTNLDGNQEGFWGVDHLGQVTDFLGLSRPNSSAWKAAL